MPQLATISVPIGADIRPLERGLQRAQSAVSDAERTLGSASARTAQAIAAPFAAAASGTASDGARAARAFVKSMADEFRQTQTDLRSALFRGSLTQEQFRAQGALSARAFNASVTQMADELAAKGMLSPEAKSALVRAYKDAGLQAGTAFSGGVRSGAAAASAELTRVGRHFGRIGERGVKASIMAGAAMSRLALDIGSSASAAEKVVRGVSDIALMFGPQGIVVSAVLNAGLILWQFFSRARGEAKKTADAFTQQMNALVDAGDQAGLEKQAAGVWLGRRSAGLGMGGGYAGGLADLRARIKLEQARMQAIAASNPNDIILGALRRRIADLKAQAAPLEKQYAALTAHLLNPIPMKGSHAMGAVGVTARSPTAPEKAIALPSVPDIGARAMDAFAARARTLTLTIQDATANAQLLVSAYDAASNKADVLPRIMSAIGPLAAKAEETLRLYPDRLSAANIEAQRLLATLAPLREMGELQFRFSKAGFTDSAADMITKAGGLENIADANKVIGDATQKKLETTSDKIVNAITRQGDTIASAIGTALGIRSASQGAGAGIGGLLGGALGKAYGDKAGSFVAKSIGGIVGSALGSVVPGLGTIAGAVVGGAAGKLIGGAIGGIGRMFGFGRHKRKAQQSADALGKLATAAQKVSEQLQNIPTGFKVALERWRIADPRVMGGGPYTGYGPPERTTGGPVFFGPVNVYGVTDAAALYRDVSRYARGQSARGGATDWQLSATGAAA